MPELITPLWILGLVGLAAYTLGSVPFGVLVAKAMGLGDLRNIGSGNIGATNVMRTGNRLAGVLTFLLDAGKGALAALLALWAFGTDAAQVAALAAFLGHLYPVFIGFRGGKGVATFIGSGLAIAWPVGLAACAIWALVFKVWRISSLAALVAAALTPVLALLIGHGTSFVAFLGMAVMIFLKHSENISRLRDGTEARFDKRR